jgi:hypothetical protein
MPMRTAGPPKGSTQSSRVTSVTRPSAGDTTAPGPAGIRRGGSRKKATTNTPTSAGSNAAHGQTGQARAVTTPAPPPNSTTSAHPVRATGTASRQANGSVATGNQYPHTFAQSFRSRESIMSCGQPGHSPRRAASERAT